MRILGLSIARTVVSELFGPWMSLTNIGLCPLQRTRSHAPRPFRAKALKRPRLRIIRFDRNNDFVLWDLDSVAEANNFAVFIGVVVVNQFSDMELVELDHSAHA